MKSHKHGKFSSFKIPNSLKASIPILTTPIQRKATPKILDGQNTTAIARTGSGKTIAYLVPIITSILLKNEKCVVIVPTRELVLQVGRVAKEIIKKMERYEIKKNKKKDNNENKDDNIKNDDDELNKNLDSYNKEEKIKNTEYNESGDSEVYLKNESESSDIEANTFNINKLEDINFTNKKYNKINDYNCHKKIKLALIYGGTSVFKDFEKLNQPFDLLIATAGRLKHCIDEMNKSFYFEILCVDEMDRIFDDKLMQDDLLYILEKIKYKQKLFFSATLPEKSISLLNDTEIIKIDNELSKTLTNLFFYTRNQIKEKALIYFLDRYKNKKIVVFCGTRHTVEYLSEIISNSHKKIYSSMDQQAREESLAAFLKNRVNVLLVTDLACRGLDIKELDIVINYNMCDEKSFLHRVGRVARNGREGTAISLVCYNDIFMFYNIRDTYFENAEIGEIPMDYLNFNIKESNLKEVSERGNQKLELHRKTIKGVEKKDKISEYEIHSFFSDVDRKKEEFLKNIKNYRKTKDENIVIEEKKKDLYKDQFYIPYNNKENKSSLHFSAYSVPKDESKKERSFVNKRKAGEMFKEWQKQQRKGGEKKSLRKN
ncbi:hypothetical protein GVAV_003335 [Gurleya vavrai]